MDNIVNKIISVKNNSTQYKEENIKTESKAITYNDNKINYLINLKNNIENLDKNLHIKILKILKVNNIEYSENKNGIFVNLNNIPENTISQINNLLEYFKKQEINLNKIENIKHEINNDFFKYKKKDNKKKPIELDNYSC